MALRGEDVLKCQLLRNASNTNLDMRRRYKWCPAEIFRFCVHQAFLLSSAPQQMIVQQLAFQHYHTPESNQTLITTNNVENHK